MSEYQQTYPDIAASLIAMSGEENVIVVRRPFVEFAGSLEGGMLLSQLLYWTPRSVMGGWIAKTDNDFAKELCLSSYGVRKARKDLEAIGILKTQIKRFSGSPTVHYKLDLDELTRKWILWIRKIEFTNSEDGNCEITQSCTETTTEITAISSAGAESTSTQPENEGTALLDEYALGDAYREKFGDNGGTEKAGHWSDHLRSEPWRGWSGGHFSDCDGVSAVAQERVGSLLEKNTGERPATDGQWNGWRNTVIEIYRAGKGDWSAIERGIAQTAARESKFVPHIASRKGEVNGWASAVAHAVAHPEDTVLDRDEMEFHRRRMLDDPQYRALGGD